MLDLLRIPTTEIFALLTAIGFAAGLNLYATVAVLGLLAHFGHLPLPPGLHVLAGWPVIVVSIVLFSVEFFADKVPAFDFQLLGYLRTKRRANCHRKSNCWQRFSGQR